MGLVLMEWPAPARPLYVRRGFAINQSTLAVNAPCIARERAIVANHAMAGNRDGEFVRGTRACHGADSVRCTDTPCNFSIGYRRAGRHFLERLPHPFLESCAANIKGKIQPDPRCFNEPDDLRHQALVVAVGADNMRLWKAILKITYEFIRIVSEKDRGDAVLRRRDQYGAQRTLTNREPDLLVCTARAVLGGRHAEHARRFFVEAPA